MSAIQEFIDQPTVDFLKSSELRKADWVALAKVYNIECSLTLRKAEVKNKVIQGLVQKSVVTSDALDLCTEVTTEQLSIAKLQLEYQLERDARLAKEREKESQRLVEEKEKERQRLAEEKEKEREEKEKDRAFQLQMLQLKIDAGLPTDGTSQVKFDLTKFLKMVPKFDETDPDEFFLQFEKVSDSMKWPEDYKVMLAQSAFKGKAQVVFNSLSDVTSYETVKEKVLKGYELVPESYRLKFRNVKKTDSMNFIEFAYQKKRMFTRWLQASNVKNYDDLKNLMLLEEFKRQMPPAIKLYLEEQEPSDINKAATLAENYMLTHKGGSLGLPSRAGGKWTPKQFSHNGKQSETSTSQSNTGQAVKKPFTSKFQEKKPELKCYKCQGFGHIARYCPPGNKSSNGVTQFLHRSKVEDSFEPFKSLGFVSKVGPEEVQYPVNILRDTGASHSILVRGSYPNVEETLTGEEVILDGVGGPVNMPLAKVYLDSDFYTGFVAVAIKDSLPLESTTFLLGNDIAGGQVYPKVVVTNEPCVDSPTKNLEEEFPDLFPVCAVTRRMASQSAQLSEQETNDVETSEEDLHVNRLFDSSSETAVSDSPQVLSRFDMDNIPVTTDNLIQEQSQDPSLVKCFEEVVSEADIKSHRVCYYLRNGVLVRKYRPLTVSSADTWSEVCQIVVPSKLRNNILTMAHDNMGGHLGCNKTSDKILQNFFWPGLRKDVAKFCKSCTECQLAGKPNEVLKPVPLTPIPVVEEPFTRIILDIVGPLPRTKKGNNYLLTIMCATTRFPTAIAIKKINAKVIVDNLVNFFTQYGIPKIVQSDQGSNFTSDLFKSVMKQLGIKQYLATAYHPESQGMLERFHQTFKSMLRKYCLETGNDWDDGINILLFAIRESKQESLGFSPHQLVFGHEVRGPLKVLRDSWLEDTEQVPLCKYVEKFNNKLKRIGHFARENLKEAQSVMKSNFDRKSEDRKFEVGDNVLLLLPTYKTPLQAKYEGPYEVLSKSGNDRYIIKTPGRRKTERQVHANNLKLFQRRPVVMAANVKLEEEEDSYNPIVAGMNNSNILANPKSLLQHLDPEKAEGVRCLLETFQSVFQDVPQRCTAASHDVVLVEDCKPIKQAPYRVSPIKRDIIRQEVKFLVDNGLAEPSSSEWASPCLLVPKSDGTYRMCTDYRRVNQVSRSDSYPLPTIQEILDDLGAATFLSKVDLLRGYYQVGLTHEARSISAFVTPDGLYQYTVMPFGLKGAPATFQRMINSVIRGLTNVRAYLDDLVIYDVNWTDHMLHLKELFIRLSDARLTVNLSKSSFGHATIDYLGHQVGQGKMAPLTAKVDAIINIPPPKNRRELRRYLGMVGWYRRFCPNFAKVSAPLTNLISPKVNFAWSPQCQESFLQLKNLLINKPVLKCPDFNRSFQVQVDASDAGAGAVLLQEAEGADKILHPVCYMSHKFKPHQRSYSTVEKELLALILALEKWDIYLGQGKPILVFSDHSPLQFLTRMKNKNQRLTRWALFLQKYDITVKHIKGKENVIADMLSRVI